MYIYISRRVDVLYLYLHLDDVNGQNVDKYDMHGSFGYNFMYASLCDLMICFMMSMSIAADSFLSGSDTDPNG